MEFPPPSASTSPDVSDLLAPVLLAALERVTDTWARDHTRAELEDLHVVAAGFAAVAGELAAFDQRRTEEVRRRLVVAAGYLMSRVAPLDGLSESSLKDRRDLRQLIAVFLQLRGAVEALRPNSG
jgi:hypothetical protein